MRLPAPRQQSSELGDSLAKAVELVLTPLIFAGIGWLVDRWLGVFPAFTIALAVVALVGKFVAEWYRYDHKMETMEAERDQARVNTPAAVSLKADDTPDHLPVGITLDGASNSSARAMQPTPEVDDSEAAQ